LTAGNNVGRILITTNSGGNWLSTTQLVGDITALAASADGAKLVALAGVNAGPVYTSTNSGLLWVKQTNAPVVAWTSVASSADGIRLVASGALNGTSIYTSTNSGITWNSNSLPTRTWRSVASSADGGKLFAVANAGEIWISQSLPGPQLSIALTGGAPKLSWTIPSSPFVMQQSHDLRQWTDVTNPPAFQVTTLQYKLTLPLTVSNGFFRLKTP
jgi:hypothetical protein